ncbi:hypothetical protein NFI96_012400 [Prochilodus magdalenae]|nr:hypothetical protein NFI96_012400 [Prochilodus magdalenae]
MELHLASLVLATLLTLLTSEVTPSLGQKVYTNTWAVHITGGEEEANRIARKHGFVNHGNDHEALGRSYYSLLHLTQAVLVLAFGSSSQQCASKRGGEAHNPPFLLSPVYMLEHPHTVPADGAVGVEVEGHQAFWMRDNRPFILVLTTVPPHTDSLGVSTKTKAGLDSRRAEYVVQRELEKYSTGRPPTPGSKHSKQDICLCFTCGSSASTLHCSGIVQVFGDYYHFRHRRVVKRSLSEHRGTHIRLRRELQVTWVEQQVVKQRKKRDIYSDPADPKFAQQWYLSCVVQPSADGAAPTGGLMEDTTARWVSGVVAVGSVSTVQSDKYRSPGDLQTQTRPSDYQTEERDWSLQRTRLHCSRVTPLRSTLCTALGNFNGNHRDLNVKEAWKQGVTGQGVVVSILDDGIEKNHPDLERNYDPDASYDVNDGDPDPQPRYTQLNDNRHGTRCAGEVAAVANNDICGVGVAYNAKIGGVRMLDGEVTDVVEAQSLSLNPQHIDIYSASWGPEDDGKTVDGPAKLAKEAFLRGVTEGRGGLGSIFVWASGNGGREKDSCNCDGYTNSIYTLSISSSTQYGNVPWYSEACSSTLATTYSSGGLNEKQIITTDLRQKCTDSHTGTSASAPLAAGIIALALEANKNLTWRDMQHLVVRTSNPVHLITSDWRTNGVGRKVSHSYGYGLLDAAAIVSLAKNWTNVGPQQKCVLSLVSEPTNIANHLVITKSVDACAGKPNFVSSLEHAQAQLTLSYNRRGNLAIYLISPQGTRSTLLAPRPHDYSSEGFNDWAFMTTHSWDEDPRGEWTLEIENVAGASDYGTLTQFTLVLFGTASSSGGPSTPDSSQPADGSCKTYDLSQRCTECNPGFYQFQQDCVRECPPGHTAVPPSLPASANEVPLVLHPTCEPCHTLCLTCSGTGPQDCLSCPPHSHLDPVTNTCLHQNQILRESPDGGPDQQQARGSSGVLSLKLTSSLPVTMAVVSCAFIVATFVGVFSMLQLRSRNLTKMYSVDGGPGSLMRSGFGLARNGIVSYKGIPSVWHEDGVISESENEEFDVQNERTAFIKTQSAL